jgi:hypothetical protein
VPDLDALAHRLGVSPHTVTATLAQTLHDSLATYIAATSPGSAQFPIPGSTLIFSRTGHDGRLGQTAQATFLTDVTLTTRADKIGQPGVLCVLGDLYDRPAPVGDPLAKSTVVTTPNTAGTMIITGPAAQRFVLCPSVLRALLSVYLDQVLDSSILHGVQPSDVPGYTTLDSGAQQNIADALRKGQVGYFFDLVLPFGLPPVSYRPALGEVVWGRLRPGIQVLLSDTDAAMAEILPSQCGGNRGMPMPDSKLTSIETGLIPDNITLGGVIEPTAWGVGGRIKFSTSLFAFVDFNGNLSLTASPPKIDSTIELEWYAVVIGAIVGAVLAGLTAITGGASDIAGAAAVGAIAGTVASLTAVQSLIAAFAVNAVTYQLNQTLRDLVAPALPLPANTVPTAIKVGPEGMSLHFGLPGGLTTPPALTPPVPSLSLTVSISSNRQPTDSGTVEIDNQCVHGMFSYQDYTITTYATFTARASGLTEPVTYEWTIDGTPMDGPYGLLTSSDPIFNMNYSFSQDHTIVTVLNQWGSPTHNRLVHCVATGADGISAEAGRGAIFIGFERDMDSSYNAQLAKCLAGLTQHLGSLGHLSGQPTPASGVGPVSGQDLAGLIASLTPGGELDPRAGGLLASALGLAGGEAAAAREALAAAGHIGPAGLEP